MSVDLLGNLTEADAAGDRLLFEKNEIVEFQCIEPRVDETKGHIFLKCRVNSGIHQGKEHTIMISGGDHDTSKKFRAQFFFKSGFWTPEELAAKTPEGKSALQLSKLVGRRFQGKASAVKSKDGMDFQNFMDIRDLGPGTAPVSGVAATY